MYKHNCILESLFLSSKFNYQEEFLLWELIHDDDVHKHEEVSQPVVQLTYISTRNDRQDHHQYLFRYRHSRSFCTRPTGISCTSQWTTRSWDVVRRSMSFSWRSIASLVSSTSAWSVTSSIQSKTTSWNKFNRLNWSAVMMMRGRWWILALGEVQAVVDAKNVRILRRRYHGGRVWLLTEKFPAVRRHFHLRSSDLHLHQLKRIKLFVGNVMGGPTFLACRQGELCHTTSSCGVVSTVSTVSPIFSTISPLSLHSLFTVSPPSLHRLLTVSSPSLHCLFTVSPLSLHCLSTVFLLSLSLYCLSIVVSLLSF